MERTLSTIVRWAGRACILLAALILVCSLFLPDAVQPLNSVVCPKGTVLDNSRYTLPNAPDNEKLELVCTSRAYTESAAKDILLIVAGLIVVGTLAIWFSGTMRRTVTKRPNVPQMH